MSEGFLDQFTFQNAWSHHKGIQIQAITAQVGHQTFPLIFGGMLVLLSYSLGSSGLCVHMQENSAHLAWL